jgi:hypothetical protein
MAGRAVQGEGTGQGRWCPLGRPSGTLVCAAAGALGAHGAAVQPDLPGLLPGEDRQFGRGLFVDLVPESCWFTNADPASTSGTGAGPPLGRQPGWPPLRVCSRRRTGSWGSGSKRTSGGPIPRRTETSRPAARCLCTWCHQAAWAWRKARPGRAGVRHLCQSLACRPQVTSMSRLRSRSGSAVCQLVGPGPERSQRAGIALARPTGVPAPVRPGWGDVIAGG